MRLGHLQKLGFALAATSALMLPCHSAQARNGISLIRDAEIEGTLRDMSTPIFEAAGIAPSSVQIYIVKDDRLNAFVAGGMNLFLNTGLLMRTEHPGQLIGVIAHEVGHIAGGHLSRIGTAQKRATAEMILSTRARCRRCGRRRAIARRRHHQRRPELRRRGSSCASPEARSRPQIRPL